MKLQVKVLPRGDDKYYGTLIQFVTQFQGQERNVGNPVRIWYFADWIGGHAPSERETDPQAGRHNDHYESKADLYVAQKIAEALDEMELEELEDDEEWKSY